MIQSLEQQFSIDLLDKMNVTHKDNSNAIHYTPLIEFKKLVKEKTIIKDTIVFNNLVDTIEDYLSNWEI